MASIVGVVAMRGFRGSSRPAGIRPAACCLGAQWPTAKFAAPGARGSPEGAEAVLQPGA